MSHEEDIIEPRTGAEGYQPKINDIAQNFLTDLEKERSRLAEDFPLLSLLIEEGMLYIHILKIMVFYLKNIFFGLKQLSGFILRGVYLVENFMLMF